MGPLLFVFVVAAGGLALGSAIFFGARKVIKRKLSNRRPNDVEMQRVPFDPRKQKCSDSLKNFPSISQPIPITTQGNAEHYNIAPSHLPPHALSSEQRLETNGPWPGVGNGEGPSRPRVPFPPSSPYQTNAPANFSHISQPEHAFRSGSPAGQAGPSRAPSRKKKVQQVAAREGEMEEIDLGGESSVAGEDIGRGERAKGKQKAYDDTLRRLTGSHEASVT